MDPLVLRDSVRKLVEPTVQRMGYDLVAVEWVGAQGGMVLRLSIDRPEGVDIGDCTELSARVSPLLDEADPVPHEYRLEVSSPGIERPVQRLDDFEALVGFRVRVRLFEGHPRRRYTGELKGVDGHDIVVEVDGQEHRIDHESIERAHLVLDLDEYERLPEVLYGDRAAREESQQ